MVKTDNAYRFSDGTLLCFSLNEETITIKKNDDEIPFTPKYSKCIFSEDDITLVIEVGPYFKTQIKITAPVTVENIVDVINNYYSSYITDDERKKIITRENEYLDKKDVIISTPIVREQINRKNIIKQKRFEMCNHILNEGCRTPKEEFVKMTQDELDEKLYRYELQTYHVIFNGLYLHKGLYYIMWSPKE